MAADQLFVDGIEGIVDVEVACFGGHLREEDGLQHEVAQLVAQARPSRGVDGIQHFIGLFERVRLDGVEGLFAIPGAAVRRAQPGHESPPAARILRLP